ncbi:zinc finger and SCAN domain-containing protein 12-like [Anopheles maculipalpis]|uniref:zinc finger and SCAN domain-containing protein 12-like n=1 Tax=Anopheles maculipalpis TaxID=1496333 RepID=UPI00215940A2|nr:zinc finger and SCAN domain-containing protein 12-like [Anopheles maculipalpis]
MKCVVPGCNTDDNVVSYTSVFYVNLPDDQIVQQQWFSLLEVTDADLMQALSDGEVKVCSCHFAEESFGRHPVHGYRYLPSTALPSILPQRNVPDTPPNPTKESDSGSKETPLDYFFVYLDEPTGIDHVPLDQGPDRTDLDLIDDLNVAEHPTEPVASFEKQAKEDKDVEPIEENDDDELVEEIGIEYANGKYYFLKLDDDHSASEDNDARISEVESNGNDDHEDAVIWRNANEETPTKVTKQEDESTLTHTIPDVDDTDEVDEEFEENRTVISDSESVSDDAKEVHLKDTSIGLLGEEPEQKIIPDDIFVIEPLDAKSKAQDEPEIEQLDRDSTLKDDALSEAEYGSIEALEDTSICSDEDWKQNQQKDKGENRFFCEHCERGFRYKSFKDRHVLIHTREKKYSCGICDKRFSQKINLTIHMRVHTGETVDKKFTCQICQKKCIRMSELQSHMMKHFRQFPHVCPLCTQRYSDATAFYDHFQAQHQQEMTFRELFDVLCENENTMIISGLELPDVEEKDGSFACSVCGKSYRGKTILERHKRKMHVKIFACPHCNRKFPYKSLLAKHLPTHTLEKPYKCPHCTLSYTQRVNLRVHIERKHTELQNYGSENYFETDEDEPGDEKRVKQEQALARIQRYECEVCGKRFTRKPSLMLHLTAHEKCADPVTFDCTECGISLCARISLIRHRARVHGWEGPKDNVLGNLELRNVTIVPTDDNRYVEIEDETDTIVEDYGNEC